MVQIRHFDSLGDSLKRSRMRVWGMHERTNIQLSRTDRSQLKAVVANRNSARVAPDVRKRQQDSVFPTLSQPIDPLLQEHGLAVARGGSDQGDRAGV